MVSPDERARDSDRNAATKLVEAAFKAGRIIEADRDKRVDELRQAQTMQDIDMVVRDLRHAARAQPAAMAGSTVPPAVAAGQQAWPQVNYGPGQGDTTEVVQLVGNVGKAGKTIGGVIAAVVLLSVIIPVVGVVIALVAARDSFPDNFASPIDETTYAPGQEPGEGGINVLTVNGFDDLVDAVREETGSTEVFDATIYPRYAVLDIPVQSGSGRYQSYFWDGGLSTQGSKGSTNDRPFSLEDLDVELMIRLVNDRRAIVDLPTIWYVSAVKPADTQPQLVAYACNDFSECEYVVTTFDGEVIYDSATA